MAKKIWFSKPLARQWDIYLKNYKHYHDNVEQFFQRMLQKLNNPFQGWQKNQLNTFVWSLWYSDATKKMLHLYFVDKSLKEFLENVSLADLDGISKYIDENGLITDQCILQLKYFPFGIHIPYENKYKAGVRIFHKKFGEGIINYVEEEGDDLKVDINFDKVGHKRLMAKFANLEIIE